MIIDIDIESGAAQYVMLHSYITVYEAYQAIRKGMPHSISKLIRINLNFRISKQHNAN